ncbi:MAG TPA: OmpA family protein [Allosphingosinicella sp.]|jgi:outer membrane protein OmpA-like peptidoglycan-associated protein
MPVKHRISTALFTAALLSSTAACVTNPETGEREFPVRTAVGAGLGAVGGYLLGDLIGGNRTAAILGAGIGALGGGAVGQYMDRQEARLRQQTAGTGIEVERQGDQLVLRMPEGITFAYNRYDIQPQFRSTLDQVAGTLQEYRSTAIDIYGHTDSTGSDAYNQTLSERRAQSVADYLVGRGIDRVRLGTRGFGETQPIADNGTDEGRAANRRVELRIVPITQ